MAGVRLSRNRLNGQRRRTAAGRPLERRSTLYFRSMIRLGNSARFTPHEIDEFRQFGLDMGHVKHQTDIEQALSRWAHILADERFDLLEKIAFELAKANGAKLPAKFRVLMQVRPHARQQNNIETRREWPDAGHQLPSADAN